MNGTKLKELREKADMTIKQVADNMGCAIANICMREKATGLKLPTIESYLKACGYEVETTIKLTKDGKQQEIKL